LDYLYYLRHSFDAGDDDIFALIPPPLDSSIPRTIKMLGIKKALKYLLVLGPLAMVEAAPTDYWATRALAARQAAASSGLSDVDILQL
jgi:hypothetical protein